MSEGNLYPYKVCSLHEASSREAAMKPVRAFLPNEGSRLSRKRLSRE